MPIYPSDLDIPPFQLRRAVASTVSNYVPAEGEPVWATDTQKLYVGDGTTAGGIEVTGGGSGGISTVTDQLLFTTSSVTFSDVNTGLVNGIYVGERSATSGNAVLGNGAMDSATSDATYNTAIGEDAMGSLTSGDYNTALGFGAMSSVVTANYNTALGVNALANATGTGNLGLGFAAGQNLGTGDYNVFIGYDFTATTNASSTVFIGEYASEPKIKITQDGLFLRPIRSSTSTQVLYYDTDTKEVTYGDPTGGGGSSYDQDLNTTDNVTFNSVKTAKVTSAGGFPLDSNGEALIISANTQTPALVVSNYTAGIIPQINVRGYGQNRPGTVGSTTPATPGIQFEGSRGTEDTPTATGNGDTLMLLGGGGFDGARWSSDINLQPAQIIALAAENHAGSSTTATNAGSRILMRTQAPGVQLNSTSRQGWMNQFWTAASGSNPPQAGINFGAALNDTPTLTNSAGTTTWTGHGATAINKINTKNYIFGVPSQDSAADNPTLAGTNFLLFASGRRSGVSGRRDALQSGDSLGIINFYGQTANNSTGAGSIGGNAFMYALENFGSGARGTGFTIQTVNSGTTTLSTRLSLDNAQHIVSSDNHQFTDADSSMRAEIRLDYTHFDTDSFEVRSNDGSTTAAAINTTSIALNAPVTFSGSYTMPTAAPASNGEYLEGQADGSTAWTDRVNAKTIFENVKNVSGGELTKGTPVYQIGITGNTITVGAARADDATKVAIGVLDETLADEAEGRMIVLGEIKGVDTSAFATGDKVYLGAAGGYTNVAPTEDNFIQFLGVVNRVDDTNGSGFITGTLTPDAVKTEGGVVSTWNGTVWEPVIGRDSTTGITTTATTTIYTFDPSVYDTAKLTITAKDSGAYHAVEMLVVSDGTNTWINEYGTVQSGTDLATFTATISSGQVVVQTNAIAPTDMTIKVTATLTAV